VGKARMKARKREKGRVKHIFQEKASIWDRERKMTDPGELPDSCSSSRSWCTFSALEFHNSSKS
jgi:hypothetical protein